MFARKLAKFGKKTREILFKQKAPGWLHHVYSIKIKVVLVCWTLMTKYKQKLKYLHKEQQDKVA